MRSVVIAVGLQVAIGFAGAACAGDRLAELGIRVSTLSSGVAELRPEPVLARPPDALPDARPGQGANDIAEAWLIGPSVRYDHGILGDAIEASGLRVVLRDGKVLEYGLDEDSVFEDLMPRIADLDGDGRDEVIVVRTYLNAGAALAVFGVTGDRVQIRAETPPIGRPHRWLNPVGVGDFDGDGAQEIAYVETPHIGGILRIVSLREGRLLEEAAEHGFSNHAIGSRALGLSAILDVDGDGRDDILVPANGRKSLRIVSFSDGTFRELGAIAHPAAIVSDFEIADRDGNGRVDVTYGLADGSLVVLNR